MSQSKDAYYFPHFCNARHDRKITRLRKELGIEGYGIFFMLLEVLRDQTDLKYPMADVDLLADEFGTSEQKVKAVISGYDLFNIDDQEKFFSAKLILYLQPYFERSEHARIAAKTRWDKGNAPALPGHSESNANKVKESKVNQSKVKENKKNEYPPEFEIWYKDYPNPENKGQTFRNWKTALKEATVEQLEAAKNNYKAKMKLIGRDRQFMKNSSNFLGKDATFKEYLNFEPEGAKDLFDDSKEIDPSRLRYQELSKEWQ